MSADIVTKIKKLLRLARSSNRHEAELALSRALELARANQIEIDQLNPDEAAQARATTHRDTKAEARLSYDKRYALAIVRSYFRVTTVEVQCLRSEYVFAQLGVKVMFIGTSSEIEIAIYVYRFLVAHFARCWRSSQSRFRNRQAYVHGMYLGVAAKLEEQRAVDESGTAIVLAEHNRYIAETLGEVSENKTGGRPDHNAHAAAWAGYQEGRQTEIRGALKPSTREQPLALTS